MCDTEAMRRAARPVTALTDGCCVCGVTRHGMLIVRATGEMICRPCGARLPALFAAASDEFLKWLWRGPSESSGPPPFLPAHAPVDLLYAEIHQARVAHALATNDEVFAKFKAGVDQTIGPDDTLAHCDLATAYFEMGLVADALREATYALPLDVEHQLAERMFNRMFDTERARPDALSVVAAVLRRH